MTPLRQEIEQTLRTAIELAGLEPPADINDDTPLLNTGLDSLGLAMLVVDLEDKLGYDPFTLTKDPVYPRTLGELVAFYKRHEGHRR